MKNKETQIDDRLKQESCKILEVQANVTVGELKKAYYRLAKRFHPDKNPDSVLAAHHFVRINTAYQTLRSGLRAGDVTDWTSRAENDHFKDPQGEQTNPTPKSAGDAGRMYKDASLDELLTRIFGESFQTSTTKTSQKPRDPLLALHAFAVEPNVEEICSLGDDGNGVDSDDLWIQRFRRILTALQVGKRNGSMHPLKAYLFTNGRRRRPSSGLGKDYGRADLIPILCDPSLLRCAHCYRAFRSEVAKSHVVHCYNKAVQGDGHVPNALGRIVATGCSPGLIRSRQYAEMLLQRARAKNPCFNTKMKQCRPESGKQNRRSAANNIASK
ncbi:hypothetical protein CRM22_004150 [Opisthorchis felineus]|uniref:J domain-containing protein n=1 Tax=Opisthorchis felineus TaxID=147828 RepID=A0A4S2LXM8_OPIFE|nr:hypothetical protein CRM22_004150 [Opisthorchis felineus]